MSIKLKDTIYDLINKATKDGSGNIITSTYLKLSGGTLTGILTITDNQYIGSTTSSAFLAVGDNSVFTGATNNLSTIFGSISLPAILRSSANNLTHYRSDKSTNYIILDAFNYTDYAATKDHTHSGYALSSHSHSNYVDLSTVQTISGKKTFSNGLAITGGATENTSLPFFIGIEAYSDGGTVKYISRDKVLSCIGAASSGHTHSYLPLSGGSLIGNLNLYNSTSSGDSPHLIFQIGTQYDGYYDWDIYNTGGELRFRINTSNSTSAIWEDVIKFYPSTITTGYLITANTFKNSSGTEVSYSGHTHSQYYSSDVSRTKNTVLAAPNGSNGNATFRSLVSADIPNLAISKISNLQSTLDGKAPISHSHSQYLPLTGGTITGKITLSNETVTTSIDAKTNGSFYSLLFYSEYDSFLGQMESTSNTYIRSGNNNLIHRKNGTDYIILDSSNYTSYIGGGSYVTTNTAQTITASKTFSTTVYIYQGTGIEDNAGNGIVGAAVSGWTGAASGSVVFGSILHATYLRSSGNNLYHYNNNNSSSYIILDSGNYSSYALPRSGGNVSGHIYFTGANASSSTASTSQIVFGTSSNNHVCISSNNNVLIINPTTSSTTNQIALYLDSKSQFPSGINVGSLSIGGETITFTT